MSLNFSWKFIRRGTIDENSAKTLPRLDTGMLQTMNSPPTLEQTSQATSWIAKLRRPSSMSLSSPISPGERRPSSKMWRRSSKWDNVSSFYGVDAMIKDDPSEDSLYPMPAIPATPPQLPETLLPRTYAPILSEPSPSLTPTSRRSEEMDLFTPIDVNKSLQHDSLWRTLPKNTMMAHSPASRSPASRSPALKTARSAEPLSPLSAQEEFEPRKSHSAYNSNGLGLTTYFADLPLGRSPSVDIIDSEINDLNSMYSNLDIEDAEIIDTPSAFHYEQELARVMGRSASPIPAPPVPERGDQKLQVLSMDYYSDLVQDYRDIAAPSRNVFDEDREKFDLSAEMRYVPKPLFFAADYRGLDKNEVELSPINSPTQSSTPQTPISPTHEESRIRKLSRSLSRRLSLLSPTAHSPSSPISSGQDFANATTWLEDPTPEESTNRTSYGIRRRSSSIKLPWRRQSRMDTMAVIPDESIKTEQGPVQDHIDLSPRAKSAQFQGQPARLGPVAESINNLKRATAAKRRESISQKQQQEQEQKFHARSDSKYDPPPTLVRKTAQPTPSPPLDSRWSSNAILQRKTHSDRPSTDLQDSDKLSIRSSLPSLSGSLKNRKSRGLDLLGFRSEERKEERRRNAWKDDLRRQIRVVGQADPAKDVAFLQERSSSGTTGMGMGNQRESHIHPALRTGKPMTPMTPMTPPGPGWI